MLGCLSNHGIVWYVPSADELFSAVTQNCCIWGEKCIILEEKAFICYIQKKMLSVSACHVLGKRPNLFMTQPIKKVGPGRAEAFL